ncbi:MAG TPA: 30S ribosomal protein S16 [Candidatus Omnitrophica bacterium]|nr:30S ribosomal protein S16 [Candidatus Omnitrophota bacterium]
MRKVGKGGKKRFYFRIAAIDDSKSRDGAIIEELGSYDPVKKEDNFKIKRERFDYWKSKGAVVSQTIQSLIKKAGKTVS